MEHEPRKPKTPRADVHYRWWRRNQSTLNRDKKNWFGADAKYVGHPKIEEKIIKKQVRDEARQAARESQG